ncbi:MAG: imidazole glycerol phosphate synthase subunit HisH [Verrucomicrobiales bacterium VVV1]|nr:MAG: imidazole glycerol phosphate synthase subunit HisH [Verrucomicrobiales bacterium VVV1]
MIVALIDYGAGNLRSVANALKELGITPRIVADASGLEGTTHLVLPGVGSFGDCMARLEERGLVSALRERIASGMPYLGICLGYQILFEESEETPGVSGLGIFAGKVKRFQEQPGLKIPHMGWNSVIPSTADSGIWKGLGPEPYFYYVHSYFPVPADPSIIAATTTYGADTFAGAVQNGAIFACQFHPEKSQNAGIRLLRNFFEA